MKQHIPNILSIIRAFLAGALLVLALLPHDLVVAQIIFVTALITDKLDGTLARLWNAESELGKKLESVVDPFLGLTSGVYLMINLDIPNFVFWYALCSFALVVLFRAGITLKKGALFYEKSPLTRYGVGFYYLFALWHVMQWPGREYFAWPLLIVGTLVSLNYMRMMAQSNRPPLRGSESEHDQGQ